MSPESTHTAAAAPDRQPSDLPLSQGALDAMPFPFVICTCDGLYVAANDLVEHLFHVPKAALIGRFNFLTDPVSQDTGARAVFQAASAGQRGEAPPTFYAFTFPGTRTPDRTGCWVTSTFMPFRDATGQVTHVGMLIQDVSERVESEQKALRLTAMIENALDAMGTIDLQGRITYCNEAYLALTGYGAELIGVPITTIFADDGDAVLSAVNQVIAHGQWRGPLTARHADGRSFPAEVSAFPLRDRTGAIIGLAATIRDLTEQQAQDRRLRQVEVLVENAPDGFSYTDLEGRLVYMNPAFRAMLGYHETPVGAPLDQFFAAHEHARIPELTQVVVTQGGWQGPLGYQRADGSWFTAHLTAFIVRDETGAPLALAGIARDLTAQQRAEAERTVLQEQVIAAQQAALRELSTPLIPIVAGVVVMPLIGSIDSSRAQLVVETLLGGVATLRAHTTIIDITGVPVVDTQVANALLRAAQAVRLLGAQVILTGIRPEVAQTLVGLGVDLSGISTRGTLQAGITEALSQRAEVTPHGWR